MNKKRAIITSLVIIGIIAIATAAIATITWLSSNKVVKKKSVQKGVLVNVDTWEVLDQVEVELDGELTYDSKFSKSLNKYNGKINMNFTNNKRKPENNTNTRTIITPLVDEKDSRCYGIVKEDSIDNPKTIGLLCSQDNKINTFMIRYFQSGEENKNKLSDLCVIAPAYNVEEAKRIYTDYMNY
ncbi:MAG: hypothetical protein Q4F05_08275 [bacterium]|nr:hypothetical protein [bacterium]